jgi:hypothetical protein
MQISLQRYAFLSATEQTKVRNHDAHITTGVDSSRCKNDPAREGKIEIVVCPLSRSRLRNTPPKQFNGNSGIFYEIKQFF